MNTEEDIEIDNDFEQIEDNKLDFPKEQLEKLSKTNYPMQAFCDFKNKDY